MIDWQRIATLREEVGHEDFDEVVELFLLEVDEAVSGLDETAPAEQKIADLHSIRGSAMSLGFRQFSKLCHKVEKEIANDVNDAFELELIQSSYATSRLKFLAELPQQFA